MQEHTQLSDRGLQSVQAQQIERERIEQQQLQQGKQPYLKQALLYALGRLGKDNLTQVASSLTFTTVLAIVPLLAVILSLFTAFPIFNDFQKALEDFMMRNLMPGDMAQTIMDYLNSFAEQARKMTAVGLFFLLVTSVLLMKTIDETLNNIWQIKKQRPLSKRILVYWALLTIGPLVLGASLWASTYLASEKFGLIVQVSILKNLFATIAPIALSCLAFTLLFYVIPNRIVYFKDALIGGITTGILLEVMKIGFAYYITKFPSYTVIYGAFATIPLFLIWIYVSWLIILLGAMMAAIAPQIRSRHYEYSDKAGLEFMLAINILRILHRSRDDNPPGKSTMFLLKQISGNSAQVMEILEKLATLGYIVNTQGTRSERWVLASSEDQDMQALGNFFLLNQALLQNVGDDQLRSAIARLVQQAESVSLKEIL